MSDIISLVCKNCGGHLSYKNSDILVCDSCGTEFTSDEKHDSFYIVAGKIEKYNGVATIIKIPDNVLEIGKNAFKDLTTLTSVILPASLMRIENSAFENCVNLSTVVIPANVDYIGDCAFKNSGLTKLTINGSLTYMGQEAFMGCTNLLEITIVGTIKNSGVRVFKHCAKLENVNVDLKDFSGSLKPGIEAKRTGDIRPTFFDFFQGTTFYQELEQKSIDNKCFYCGNDIDKKGHCINCGEQNYDKQGGCYVATCVYGSYDCPEVWTLRRYRDNTLASTWYGRAFIRTYYAISPTLVKWFGKTKWFKKLWKGKLDKMVKKLQDNGVENTPMKIKSGN